MWAQIIKARLKPGAEEQIRSIQQEFETAGDNTPWVRSVALADQNDPGLYYNVVFFESEEAARANENSPEQQARVHRIQELYDGQPEFVNCDVVYETAR
jgi:heme-degrading monooxygenase HmoA